MVICLAVSVATTYHMIETSTIDNHISISMDTGSTHISSIATSKDFPYGITVTLVNVNNRTSSLVLSSQRRRVGRPVATTVNGSDVSGTVTTVFGIEG